MSFFAEITHKLGLKNTLPISREYYKWGGFLLVIL